MAIEVVIKQRLFGNKNMPLRVMLGDDLQHGFYDGDYLEDGKLGGSWFIAYNPKSVGRGITIMWKPGETREITLQLVYPSTKQEITDFYSAVERMAKHWGGSLTVDGTRTSLREFLSTLEQTVQFSNKVLDQICSGVIYGEHEELVLNSAKWRPLTIGIEEARRFLGDPDYYAWWLHERQTLDAYYESPVFCEGKDGLCGIYMLTNDLVCIFPHDPAVPLGSIILSTGESVECDNWTVVIAVGYERLCEIEYSRFLELIPKEKISRFDAGRFLLAEMTEEEIRAIADKLNT